MERKDKIVETALKKYTDNFKYLMDNLYRSGIPKDESKDVLKRNGLDTVINRVKFVRDAEYKLENLINECVNKETFEYIVMELNKYINENREVKIHDDVIKSFVGSRRYNTLNDMRAFKALCDGDYETYKIFATKSNDMFMYCVIRVLALITGNVDEVLKIGESISAKYEEGYEEKEITLYRRVLRKEMAKDGHLIRIYKAEMQDKDICFYNGIVDIIEPILRGMGYDKFCDGRAKIEVDLNNDISLDEKEDKNDVLIDSEVKVSEDDKVSTYEILKDKISQISTLIEDLEREKTPVVKSRELEDLEIENNRLKNEIERLKVKAEGPSLKEFIQMAGGRGGNYQLSELYLISEDLMNDDGNSIGRIINILTMLESFGASAYFGDKRYNEVFEIERRELAKKYMLVMPLKGDEEVVKVKLIKNGWMLNGQVIVLPLVEQI